MSSGEAVMFGSRVSWGRGSERAQSVTLTVPQLLVTLTSQPLIVKSHLRHKFVFRSTHLCAQLRVPLTVLTISLSLPWSLLLHPPCPGSLAAPTFLKTRCYDFVVPATVYPTVL